MDNKPRLSPTLKATFTGVEGALDRLHRLGVAIRQASAGQLMSRIKPFAKDERVSSFEILAHSVLESLYPGANPRLLEHVSGSLAQKYQVILYRHGRDRQYRSLSWRPKATAIREQPISRDDDYRIKATPSWRNTLRPAIRDSKSAEPSVRSSTFDEDEFNKNLPQTTLELERHPPPTTSVQAGFASYLPPQTVPDGDKPANCQWCFEEHPAEMFRTPRLWRYDPHKRKTA